MRTDPHQEREEEIARIRQGTPEWSNHCASHKQEPTSTDDIVKYNSVYESEPEENCNTTEADDPIRATLQE
jgi:hypothetical protein